MLKLLSHWAVYWLELVLALPPSNGTCKELGTPKIPHSCRENKPTMKSVIAKTDGQAWTLRPDTAESRPSDMLRVGRRQKNSVSSFIHVCVLPSKGLDFTLVLLSLLHSGAQLYWACCLKMGSNFSPAVMEPDTRPALLFWVATGVSERPEVCQSHIVRENQQRTPWDMKWL